MARKAPLVARVAPGSEGTILREPKIPLTFEQRIELREIFTKKTAYIRAWNNAQHCKPSAFTGELNTALGSVVANNRLHEIRGWELFEAALKREMIDPVLKKAKVPDDFPDSGAIDKDLPVKK